MNKKIAVNLSMAPQVHRAYQDAAEKLGDKQKWLIVNAALVLFFQQPEDVRQDLMGKVAGAEFMGTYDRLLPNSPMLGLKARSESGEAAYPASPNVAGKIEPAPSARKNAARSVHSVARGKRRHVPSDPDNPPKPDR